MKQNQESINILINIYRLNINGIQYKKNGNLILEYMILMNR